MLRADRALTLSFGLIAAQEHWAHYYMFPVTPEYKSTLNPRTDTVSYFSSFQLQDVEPADEFT